MDDDWIMDDGEPDVPHLSGSEVDGPYNEYGWPLHLVVVAGLVGFVWGSYLLIMRFGQPAIVGTWLQTDTQPWFCTRAVRFKGFPLGSPGPSVLQIGPGPALGRGVLRFVIALPPAGTAPVPGLAYGGPRMVQARVPIEWRFGVVNLGRGVTTTRRLCISLDTDRAEPVMLRPLLADWLTFKDVHISADGRRLEMTDENDVNETIRFERLAYR